MTQDAAMPRWGWPFLGTPEALWTAHVHHHRIAALCGAACRCTLCLHALAMQAAFRRD